jgi:hypothetical protein
VADKSPMADKFITVNLRVADLNYLTNLVTCDAARLKGTGERPLRKQAFRVRKAIASGKPAQQINSTLRRRLIGLIGRYQEVLESEIDREGEVGADAASVARAGKRWRDAKDLILALDGRAA